MFTSLDVFVFTLGLTEAWHDPSDGAVVPIAPGVVGIDDEAERYEFLNFTSTEVQADLEEFVSLLSSVNQSCKVILTVSPVPLVATYEKRHVLTATTYSKSVLRVAADECAQRQNNVIYFPSYEIITGSYARGNYFAEDLRSVTDEGVKHVMSVFMRHFSEQGEIPRQMHDSTMGLSSSASIDLELAAGREIVCEEELLDS
ncbi:hypothetical protein MEX01_51460 [Methylorubrum extorquens]|nr:hypothetical protein MEX01_51460 [Methylorubrum extorquens]